MIVLLPVQSKIDAYMSALKQDAITSLEESLNRSISYQSISPSLLLYLEVRNVTIETFTPNGPKNVDIGKVRIYYDFWSLIKGEKFSAVTEIRLINSSFSIDRVNDQGLIDRINSLIGPSEAELAGTKDRTPPDLPEQLKISGRNISINYRTPELSLIIEGLSFTLSSRNERLQIEAEGNSTAEFIRRIPVGLSSLKTAQSNFEINSQYSTENGLISSQVTLDKFSSNLLAFNSLTLEIEQQDEAVSVRKIEDRSPWDFKIDYLPDTESIQIEFAAKEFSPIQNIEPRDDLYPYSAWLNSAVSGTANFSYSFSNRKLEYDGQLEVSAENEFLPFPVSISTKVSGTDEFAVFDYLALSSPKVDANYRGTVQFEKPFATGAVNVQKLAIGDKTLQGGASIKGTRDKFTVSSTSITIDSIEIKDILINGSLSSEEIDFEVTAAHHLWRAEDADSDIRNITVDGTYVFSENPFLEILVSTEDMPTAATIREFVPQQIRRSLLDLPLFVTTEAYLTTNFDRFSFSLLPIIVNRADGREIARGTINGNNERLKIENADLNIGRYSIGGDIELTRQSDATYDFASSVSVNSVYYELSGKLHQGNTLVVRGNYGLYLGLVIQPQFTAFSAKMDSLPLPLREEGISEITFRGRGVYRTNDNWNVQVKQMLLRDLPQFPAENQIEVSGSMRPDEFHVNTLKYSDGISILNGNLDIEYQSLNPFQGNVLLNLTNENETEMYRLIARRNKSGLQSNLQVEAAPLSRIREIPVKGLLSGSVDISGTFQNPNINFEVNLDEGEFRNGPLLLEVVGRYNEELLELNYIHAEYRSHLLQRTGAEFDFTSGSFALQGEYSSIFSRKRVSANINLTGNAEDIQEPLDLQKLGTADISAQLAIEQIELLGEQRDSWYFQALREEGTLRFSGGPEDAVQGVFEETGAYQLSLSDPLPVQFDGSGNLSEEDFLTKIDDIYIDANLIEMFGVDAIAFNSGFLTGDLLIDGAMNDPEFNGTLELQGLSGDVKFVAEPIDPFSTRIDFEGKEATVQPVRVSTGGRQAQFMGGFEFDRWTPVNIRIEVVTMHPEGVHVIYKEAASGLNVDAYALGTFIFQQGVDHNLIQGDLTARNSVITLEDKQTVDIRPKTPLVVDLSIKTGRRVEFLWPRKNLPILQAFAEPDQTVNIYFESITNTFRLTGEVSMQGGELYYFQRSFYIKEGMITFNENENNFDPLLRVDAEIKEIDNSGRPVTISLIVDNEPLSSFTPRFVSQPALSTVEIANILGANLYTQFSGTQTDLTSALLLTGDIFSQFSVVRTFEQQVKDVFNLDLFSLRTQMVQNIILERVLNQNITQDPQENVTLGRYLDNTTLFLGKYLGNDLFFEALLQIQQEPLSVGEFQQDELNFTMEVGLEWKTPLFLLNLSISPDFVDPLNSIENTSIGLSWDYSY
ncbi:MAG: translocation/assembly module TamB [Spirochaetia bacterium]|nr:translocation/assembly module TamB [Spirochaetia bacterium]